MSTTISYKSSQIASFTNKTRTLTTAGKYMEANVVVTDQTVDLSHDTVTSDSLMPGVTAHDKNGQAITGNGEIAYLYTNGDGQLERSSTLPSTATSVTVIMVIDEFSVRTIVDASGEAIVDSSGNRLAALTESGGT